MTTETKTKETEMMTLHRRLPVLERVDMRIIERLKNVPAEGCEFLELYGYLEWILSVMVRSVLEHGTFDNDFDYGQFAKDFYDKHKSLVTGVNSHKAYGAGGVAEEPLEYEDIRDAGVDLNELFDVCLHYRRVPEPERRKGL